MIDIRASWAIAIARAVVIDSAGRYLGISRTRRCKCKEEVEREASYLNKIVSDKENFLMY